MRPVGSVRHALSRSPETNLDVNLFVMVFDKIDEDMDGIAKKKVFKNSPSSLV